MSRHSRSIKDVQVGDIVPTFRRVSSKFEDKDGYVLKFDDGTEQTFLRNNNPAIEVEVPDETVTTMPVAPTPTTGRP